MSKAKRADIEFEKSSGNVFADLHRDQGVDVRTRTHVEYWHLDGDNVTDVSLTDAKR